VSFKLDKLSRRIALAVGISVLLHAVVLWGPEVRLPRFNSSLPTLTAKLEALPEAPAKPKPKRKPKPAAPKGQNEPAPQVETSPKEVPLAASEPAAASAPVETEALASEGDRAADRPPLPKHAQLTFEINKGTSHFRIGEAVHTLDIDDDGHYVLQAETRTVGLARLFKSYDLKQYSSGRYGKYGLEPELFFDERKDRVGTKRDAVEFDRVAHRARFSHGGEMALPADTQDILSVMYQFPPLKNVEIAPVFVSNGRKIEHYDFEIATNEVINTPLGKLLTVHLRKMHAQNEEGLEIWLAQEYRLFPVKLRFIESSGEVAGEAVITDIRVSEEQGARTNAVN